MNDLHKQVNSLMLSLQLVPVGTVTPGLSAGQHTFLVVSHGHYTTTSVYQQLFNSHTNHVLRSLWNRKALHQ